MSATAWYLPARELKSSSCAGPGDSICLHWGSYPVCSCPGYCVPPDTFPSFEGKEIQSTADLSSCGSPEPLWNLSPVQGRLFPITQVSFSLPFLLLFIPVTSPQVLSELLHLSSITPAVQAFIFKLVLEDDLAFL